MHKIGIISDTHGLLRPEVIDALNGCELILHGGDINRQEILDRLAKIAPVYAIRGNTDKSWADHLPQTLTLTVFGIQIFMVHDKKHIPKDLTKVDLVICGHSHRYEERTSGEISYLNPGSCGPRRFRQEITLAILYAEDNGTFKTEKVLISHSKAEHDESVAEEKTGRKIAGIKITDEGVPSCIGAILPAIMREIDAGRSVEWIAAKHRISRELSDQINRMYLTHPGVDVDGILRRLGL